MRRRCQASGVTGGSGSEFRRICDFSHSTSSFVVEIWRPPDEERAAGAGSDEGVVGHEGEEGDSEGRRRKRRRAAEEKESRSSAGTVMAPAAGFAVEREIAIGGGGERGEVELRSDDDGSF